MPNILKRLRNVSQQAVCGLALSVASVCAAQAAGMGVAQRGQFNGDCDALSARLMNLANTTISSSTPVAAGALTLGGTPIPQHCLVTGAMFERVSEVDGKPYAIRFEMRLPMQWNGRFFYQANGGIDGRVVPALGAAGGGPLTGALLQGFAVISSDAGHDGAMGADFGIDPQARLDYGYQAVGKLTPMAKQLIEHAYGRPPDHSYIGGCSNGGRHTMIAMNRYSDAYDGYLAGAPGFRLPLAAIANIFGAQRYASIATDPKDLSTAFTAAERGMVADAVLAQCDALDGATDGLIQDVDACQRAFDFDRDVPVCANERDGTCLTPAQKQALAPIFSGATTADGTPFYAPFPYDAGLRGNGIPFWEFTAPVVMDSGGVALIWKVPPAPAAGFNGPAYALSTRIDDMLRGVAATDARYTESAQQFMMPPHPADLAALKQRGAKVMVYHGVSDPIFSVEDSKAWYEQMTAANGGDATDFARFYRIPGMAHCAGGPATDQFDLLSKLVAWVEQGQEPVSIVATARGPGNAGGVNDEIPAQWSAKRTRPLCAYPAVARYKGAGSVEDAANFECR
ncbi:MAG: tannase/feruloyl esterase family alpha/beta hydrolase [Gammaproteobacteria bacterium]|nr:tannase/feruloyl esterase family alpha/beta hydrolase [Gammaproteobacteria bacterium]